MSADAADVAGVTYRDPDGAPLYCYHAERALREAGCASVERLDLCTACAPDRFFSYRRDGKPRGGHGVLARVA